MIGSATNTSQTIQMSGVRVHGLRSVQGPSLCIIDVLTYMSSYISMSMLLHEVYWVVHLFMWIPWRIYYPTWGVLNCIELYGFHVGIIYPTWGVLKLCIELWMFHVRGKHPTWGICVYVYHRILVSPFYWMWLRLEAIALNMT